MSLKVFSKNAFVYAVGTAGLRISAFLLIPVYTHFLQLKDYGLLSTILVTIQLMVTIIDLSVREGIMRLSEEYRRKQRIKYLFGGVVFINLMGGIVVYILSMLVFKNVFRNAYHIADINDYIFLTCMAATAQSVCVNIVSYYRASNEGVKYMSINLATAVLTILLSVLFFVILKRGVRGAVIAQIISYGIVGAGAFIYICSDIGFGIYKSDIVYLLKYCLPLMLATFGFSILNTSSTYFLSFFENLEHVGIYSLASRISLVGSILLILPFQLAYEPYVFSNLDNTNIRNEISRLTTYLLLIYTILSILTVFVFRYLIKLIAPAEYYSAYYLLFFLLPAVAFNGLYYIGQSLLLINKKTKMTGMIIFIISMIGVGLNYFLIKHFGITGLVINYNLSWVLIAVVTLKYGMKEYPVKLEKKRILLIGIIYVFLHTAIYMLDSTPSYLYYPVSLLLLLSFIIYLWKFYLTKNEIKFLYSLKKKIIKSRAKENIITPQLEAEKKDGEFYA